MVTRQTIVLTVSRSETEQNTTALLELHTYLKQQFPLVFEDSPHVSRSYLNTYSVLLRVQGSLPTGRSTWPCHHLQVTRTCSVHTWMSYLRVTWRGGGGWGMCLSAGGTPIRFWEISWKTTANNSSSVGEPLTTSIVLWAFCKPWRKS